MNTLRLTAMCLRLGLAAQKELTQAKMDALRDLQQKDAEAAKSRMDAIDKRLDDQISKMGQGVDRFGIWITVLLAGLGALGYFSVVRRTKAEAEDAARQWFDAHAKDLKNQIEQLKAEAQTARATIVESVEGVQEHGQSAKDGITKYVQTLQANVGDQTPHSDPKALQEAQDAVASRAEQLRNTAESSYSFDDWNTRAHAAYAANQLEDAAQHWRKAAEIPNAGSVRVAQALFNRGVTQGQLGQSAEAINTYNEVLHRFGDANEAALKEMVARAFINKGLVHRTLGQSTEAIESYDEVLRRLGDASEPALQELLAHALNSKAFAYLTEVKAQWSDQNTAGRFCNKHWITSTKRLARRHKYRASSWATVRMPNGNWEIQSQLNTIFIQACVPQIMAVKSCMKTHSKTSTLTPSPKTKACASWSSANGWLGRQNMTKAMLLGQPSRRMANFY